MTEDKITLFHKCCQAIADNREAKALNYCVGYAKAGLGMNTKEYIKVQILYILNNMTHWRGEVAKQVRADLKSI